VKREYDTDYFIIDKFPLELRPFYTMPDPQAQVEVHHTTCPKTSSKITDKGPFKFLRFLHERGGNSFGSPEDSRSKLVNRKNERQGYLSGFHEWLCGRFPFGLRSPRWWRYWLVVYRPNSADIDVTLLRFGKSFDAIFKDKQHKKGIIVSTRS
jgi:hypothetical protein